MNIYDLFENNQRPTNFKNSPELIYYNKNSYRLNEIESYSYLLNPSDSFGVVRGNIILRSLENKETIEKLFRSYEKLKDRLNTPFDEYMRNGMASLPYFSYKEEKIYVPVFPFSLALIYGKNFEKLSQMPYKRLLKQYESALIDPFDYYGYAPFVSYFTNLVLVRKEKDVAALYDYDAEAIYFVNDEGRLDVKICLFDKNIEHSVKTHIMPRIAKVVDAYFANDRLKLLSSLEEGSLISSTMISKIKANDLKTKERIQKIVKEL